MKSLTSKIMLALASFGMLATSVNAQDRSFENSPIRIELQEYKNELKTELDNLNTIIERETNMEHALSKEDALPFSISQYDSFKGLLSSVKKDSIFFETASILTSLEQVLLDNGKEDIILEKYSSFLGIKVTLDDFLEVNYKPLTHINSRNNPKSNFTDLHELYFRTKINLEDYSKPKSIEDIIKVVKEFAPITGNILNIVDEISVDPTFKKAGAYNLRPNNIIIRDETFLGLMTLIHELGHAYNDLNDLSIQIKKRKEIKEELVKLIEKIDYKLENNKTELEDRTKVRVASRNYNNHVEEVANITSISRIELIAEEYAKLVLSEIYSNNPELGAKLKDIQLYNQITNNNLNSTHGIAYNFSKNKRSKSITRVHNLMNAEYKGPDVVEFEDFVNTNLDEVLQSYAWSLHSMYNHITKSLEQGNLNLDDINKYYDNWFDSYIKLHQKEE